MFEIALYPPWRVLQILQKGMCFLSQRLFVAGAIEPPKLGLEVTVEQLIGVELGA